MAIDEKKLIEELCYDTNFYLRREVPSWIIATINAQPKISLETKTSDNMTSTSGGHAWIPCSERLPAVNEKVLVTYEKYNGGELLIGFDKRVICKYGDRWQGKGYRNIAWKPLPEAYKGE